jgi:hypothetical protein
MDASSFPALFVLTEPDGSIARMLLMIQASGARGPGVEEVLGSVCAENGTLKKEKEYLVEVSQKCGKGGAGRTPVSRSRLLQTPARPPRRSPSPEELREQKPFSGVARMSRGRPAPGASGA